ncbi:MAG: alpha/beta fold hydrolase [Phycisphaeraceae bacterium]|nr:alpha/beta fold hydrolase [Phycisphaeraceae bacterium]
MAATTDQIDARLAETTLQARFERQVEQFAERPALHSAGREVTYEQLNAAANRLARGILEKFGPAEQTVGLLVEQGMPLICAMMGSLKAGRTFVPMDPSYPPARLELMLSDSQATLLITNDANAEAAGQLAGAVPILNLDQLANDGPQDNPLLVIPPTRPAYILYTSGSTGNPKGVVQDHRAVLHNMLRHKAFFQITHEDRQTLLYPCSVYGGIRDIFNALMNGASLHHYPIRDAGHLGLGDWLSRHQITIYCSVATVFRYFARELEGSDLFPHLKIVKLGGEAPYRRDVELFREHFCAHTVLFCGLGSTETGMSRRFPVMRDTPLEGSGVPLGFAVPGVDVMLLDEQRQPLGADTLGEIAIRSRYIMQGYRGRAELNAKVLLPDPDDPQSRIFLTGDLGVMDAAGCLIHKGRKDHQVKIRGNRVELPEIETALSRCGNVQDAVVIAWTNPRGDAQLVAYIVPKAKPDPAVHELRDQLKDKLPHFMVPNLFLTIDEIPLTPNGKIDRLALPSPETTTVSGTAPSESGGGRFTGRPTTDLESKLLAIMSRVLGRDNIGVEDSFFDVGGDSMLAVKMVLQIEKELDQVLPLSGFYDTPTARKLAQWIENGQYGVEREVVTLNGNGSRDPLFCLPGRGGTVFSYRGLVRLLDPDQPVIGLQFPGLEGQDGPIADMIELATEMVRRVRRVRPHGPYLLMGYSFGGLVAFEMARQLIEAGQSVPYLAVLDAAAPGAMAQRPMHERIGLHLRRFAQADVKGKIRYVTQRMDNLADRIRRPKRNGKPSVPIAEIPEGEGRVIDALRRLQETTDQARAGYQPQPIDVNVSLFRTAAKPEWYEFCKMDEVYGWGDLARHGVRTYDIPGKHLEIFDAAHVPLLAEQVRVSLLAAGSYAKPAD